jgi:hypothetical protein
MVDLLMESFGRNAICGSNGSLDGKNDFSAWRSVRIKSGANSIKNSQTRRYLRVSNVFS